ncbi:polyprenyl synthetase family protein [Cellulomonas sp. ATA003]|uniref:polyprenyl synthetase family protein n=1 Tax=Cellulomonas sp. ATA003 TaxID=3073064 RepID=UPI002872FCC9|nr:polyprenyl synthetase family protein [Cellulomonas sp. ATA003]WNB85393.1 polyprenyl synthetase family protein [Cellulomonas sp. ATA003]
MHARAAADPDTTARSIPEPGALLARPGAPGPRDAVTLSDAVTDGLAATVDVLDGYLAERQSGGARLDPGYGTLWAHLADQVGGKLLRPRLTLAAYLGLGGDDVVGAAHVAAAQELLHTAMVVHDDLLDHDEVRRGRPNLAGSYRASLAADGVVGPGAEDHVLAAGLLGGDLALVAAFGMVTRAPVDADLKVAVIDLLVDGVSTTVAGELLDMASGLRPPAHVDTLLVAELKTAAYTCAVPLNAGAVLARADERTQVALARFGTALGTAFQLVDDELGVFGDPGRTGKSVLSDLRAGKRTELLRLSYLRADDAGRALLDAHVGRPDLDDDAAARVREVMAGCGARDELRAVAARAAGTAHDVARGHLPAELADYLCALVDEMAGRGH